ncbi:MAG: phospholipid carrier-dependent glycosyltransferase, partial [Leptospiraceae bacterium]|nr:phospholipid carrier-dependent glycosyltransferase [Leptospiraceae bacterium]
MKNKMIKNAIIIFLLFIISFLQYKSIYQIHDPSEIGYSDHDTLYMVERLIMLQNPSSEYYEATDIDYGIEMNILLPIFKVLKYDNAYDYIISYNLITGFHYLLTILNFLIVFYLFYNYKFNISIYIIFTMIVSTSTLFSTYSIFVKPDSNSVLFSILAVFFLIHRENKKNTPLLILFFISLGSLIKWWTFFWIPVLIWRDFNI